MRAPLLLLVPLLLLAPAVRAQTVAVMPFRDLSNEASSVGDAIRESMTSDLKSVARLRVVERSEIDRVLGELKLQSRQLDADSAAAVRVGKLLGADWIALGAYQRAGDTVRLTARFVKVESAEVVGTAKVDGPQTRFLALQDQVTSALLQSAGLAPAAAQRLQRRTRPSLPNLQPVELYGRAAVEKSDVKRTALLQEAVAAAPDYAYASEELAQLEMRLRGYDEAARAAVEQSLERLRADFEAAQEGATRERLRTELVHRLMAERRWRAVLSLELERVRQLEGTADTSELGQLEASRARVILALGELKLRDGVLREGERFLARHPGSPYFAQVMRQVEATVAWRRKSEEHAQKAAERVREAKGDSRWDLCQLGRFYRMEHQAEQARRLFRACVRAGAEDPAQALVDLAESEAELGDFARARAALKQLQAEDPDAFAKRGQSVAERMPADG